MSASAAGPCCHIAWLAQAQRFEARPAASETRAATFANPSCLRTRSRAMTTIAAITAAANFDEACACLFCAPE